MQRRGLTLRECHSADQISDSGHMSVSVLTISASLTGRVDWPLKCKVTGQKHDIFLREYSGGGRYFKIRPKVYRELTGICHLAKGCF